MTATDDAPDELTAAIDLLWTPPATPRRGPKPGLDLTAIATAGIHTADADGLTAVTMQRVAETLGVTKMALYRYVRGKTELVALMTDVAIGEPTPLTIDGWRAQLDTWAHAIFTRFLAHPWAQRTATGLRAIGPNEIDWTEQALTALDNTDLSGSEKLDVVATLVGHVRAIAQQAAAGLDPEKGIESVYLQILEGRETQFPALTSALTSAAEGGGQDQALEFGLARILDGVELLINARRSQ